MIPSNRVLPATNKTKADKRVNATESLLLLKGRTISQSPDSILWSMYLSKSTENDPFVQSTTNDDLLATIYVVSINFSGSSLQATYGHLLVQASYSYFNRFSNSGQTGLASFNELLKCCRELSFFSITDYSTVELASAAKVTQYSLRGREVIFHMAHRGHTHRVYKFSE